MKGGSEAAEALVSGSVDYSGNAIDHAIAAAQHGKSLVMIADFMDEPGVTFLIRPQDKGKYASVSYTHLSAVCARARAGSPSRTR